MLQKIKIFKSFLVVVSLLMLLTACHNYYMAVAQPKEAAGIDSLRHQNRYFVLRSGSEAFYMKNLSLSADRKTLEATLDTLSPEHRLHLVRGRKGNMIYHKNKFEDIAVLSEVHLYTPPDTTAVVDGRYTLALDQVQKVEVIERDKKRTTSSYVIGAIGYTVGAFTLVGIIALATKSSCPFVSAYDGNQFSLQGEIYGGAIYPQLARYDFLPLKMTPFADSTLQLKISNELKEEQYTDLAELWVVTHSKKTKVLSDEKGNLYGLADLQSPVDAFLNKKNVTASLLHPADNALLYMDDTSSADARNEVTIKFKKPGAVKKGKLVLALKNSYWLDLLYGELGKGFGSYYPTYIKQQRSKPAAELLKWTRDQQIPLEVSVKTTTGWKKVTGITTVGPLATRQMVIPIEMDEALNPVVEVRLSSGFMFWEIDYAAMDFTVEDEFTIQKLLPVKATDEGKKDVLALLQKEDGQSLAQPQIGNVATIVYMTKVLPGVNETQSFFLKTKGYYIHIRDFKNKPDVPFLKQFIKPNAFPVYGMGLYKKIREENIRALANAN